MSSLENQVRFIEWCVDFDGKEPAVLKMGLAPEEVRAVTKGRCRSCWGRLVGRRDRKTHTFTGIRCRVCGWTLEGEEAEKEFRRMTSESITNMISLPLGWASKYDDEASFVLKLFPVAERETKEEFIRRISANAAKSGKEGWLTRKDFPPGSPGYLFMQAKLLVSGVERLPRDMTAAPFSEVDLRDDGSATMRLPIEEMTRDPQYPSSDVKQKLGSTMTMALMSAFACELAMKAIRLTRLDEARKQHDLLTLYRDLPEDSRTRMEMDYPGIEAILQKARHTFGKWRYFETNIEGGGISTMADTELAMALGKAARVIVDEAEVAGLQGTVKLDATRNMRDRSGITSYKYTHHLKVEGGEASRPIKTDVRRPMN